MEKEFVPYELAVKLKALGFDEPCFGMYCKGRFHRLYPNSYKDVPEDFYREVDAPTFSQAFRWFREKYGVHSSPRKYDETKWWVEWGAWTSCAFETFEEAEISWINKLIEIVESKSE